MGSLASQGWAALICAAPGSDGPGFPSGVVNDYWPGSGSPSAGSGSVTLNGRRAGSAGNAINPGDLVLIIQIQDADINSSNTINYGGSDGTGSGASAENSAGLYEYVLATNSVGAGGGTLTFTPALTNSYRTRNYSASNGQSRWQAVRVPQFSSATANNVTAPAWDGNSGGVVVLDVEKDLTLSGATAIDVNGLGFRGGAGRTLGGGAGNNTDFRTLATINTNASKGEGIAGTPRYINNTSAYNAAPNVTNTGVEGYPSGSYARGAPGNAGGGGTDGDPANNDENTGGGGGSNYGFGGQGGDAWSWPQGGVPGDFGGRGGGAFSSVLGPGQVFLGGGGGAGTTNNGTSDAATYTDPPGVSCTAGNGACSSGAAGGGIVLIRAGSIAGSGTVTARGADAYNVANDGGGGGGGGGTVVLQSYFGGSARVDVSGGNGGNAWRSRNTLIDRHGPGGGGGGGFIAYSPSTGFALTAFYAAGLSGLSSNDDPFGSTSGNGGITTFDIPDIPGIPAGTFCPPAIKAVSLAVDNGAPGAVDNGDTIEYTVVYRNGSNVSIPGFNITDSLPAGVNYVPGSLTVNVSGGASASANPSYDGSASTRLLASNISLPSAGIITATIQGTAVAPNCTDVYNQANSVQSGIDVLGLTDNADNTQNDAGLPSGSYFDQTDFGTAGATDATGFHMGCADMSTSTKSWVDLNGGVTEPGDVLRYTVTVTDSGGGPVSNTTVTDDIPANVNSFTVVSIPSGATDNSLPPGAGNGANDTGYLDISDISFASGGSVTIVFDVTIDLGLADGTTIDNSITIATPPPGTGGTPGSPTVTVTYPGDLSTSTKTVVDLNGGSVENGDVLQYTVTLNETFGHAVSGAQVTDDIPANVNNFNVISIPTGATDNSLSAGVGNGANDNGYLDITGIDVAANGTETIIFEVTVTGVNGDSISNTATVSNPTGPGAAPSAPILTVVEPPGTGNKQLYLYDDTSSPAYLLSRIPQSISGNSSSIILESQSATNQSQSWTLDPVLRSDVTIDPAISDPVPVTLFLANDSTNAILRNRNITVSLQCSSGGTVLQDTRTVALNNAVIAVSFSLDLNSSLTCAVGESWVLTVENTQNRNNRDFVIFPTYNNNPSQVILPSQNVINVDSVKFYDAAYDSLVSGGGGSEIFSATEVETVYVRAQVSDPFGEADINGASLTLTDAGGTVQVSPPVLPATNMSEVTENPVNAATRTYEYVYTTPAFPVQGNWTAQVESFEGTEGTISHSGAATLLVQTQPLLTILKSASAASARTGDEITYSVVITNTGAGTALNVVVTDDLSPYSAWGLDSFGSGIPFSLTQLAPGSPADSGLNLGTATYFDENDAPITPTSGGGGALSGFDGRVDRFELPMTGNMSVGGQFQLQYKVIVK